MAAAGEAAKRSTRQLEQPDLHTRGHHTGPADRSHLFLTLIEPVHSPKYVISSQIRSPPSDLG